MWKDPAGLAGEQNPESVGSRHQRVPCGQPKITCEISVIGRQITIKHIGGVLKRAEVTGWCDEKSTKIDVVFLGVGPAPYIFSLNHGWCMTKGAKDWRISDGDLKQLREYAISIGRIVVPVGRSPGPARKPKTGLNPHPRQLSFGDEKEIIR
jgi:hypothetical protein